MGQIMVIMVANTLDISPLKTYQASTHHHLWLNHQVHPQSTGVVKTII
jgi:hypothetical protein